MNIDFITKEDLKDLQEKLDLVLLQTQKMSGVQEQIYTTKDLAKLLKVSTKTIQNWRDKKLIAYAQIQSTIIFQESAVKDFLSNQTIKHRIR